MRNVRFISSLCPDCKIVNISIPVNAAWRLSNRVEHQECESCEHRNSSRYTYTHIFTHAHTHYSHTKRVIRTLINVAFHIRHEYCLIILMSVDIPHYFYDHLKLMVFLLFRRVKVQRTISLIKQQTHSQLYPFNML